MLQKMKTKSIFKVRNLKSPRVIKTHLALDMLPTQACIVIVFILSLFEFVCVLVLPYLYICVIKTKLKFNHDCEVSASAVELK